MQPAAHKLSITVVEEGCARDVGCRSLDAKALRVVGWNGNGHLVVVCERKRAVKEGVGADLFGPLVKTGSTGSLLYNR
jgi:hypothetical protein